MEMPRNWPPEFARRAKENLDLVCSAGKHDVTQTVLTLYALVVVPDEWDMFRSIDDMTREEMERAAWPVRGWCWAYKNQRAGARLAEDGLKAFLRMLRNALAHGHLEFESASGSITAIKFNHGRGQNTICGRWTNEQAHCACTKVLDLIKNLSAGQERH